MACAEAVQQRNLATADALVKHDSPLVVVWHGATILEVALSGAFRPAFCFSAKLGANLLRLVAGWTKALLSKNSTPPLPDKCRTSVFCNTFCSYSDLLLLSISFLLYFVICCELFPLMARRSEQWTSRPSHPVRPEFMPFEDIPTLSPSLDSGDERRGTPVSCLPVVIPGYLAILFVTSRNPSSDGKCKSKFSPEAVSRRRGHGSPVHHFPSWPTRASSPRQGPITGPPFR